MPFKSYMFIFAIAAAATAQLTQLSLVDFAEIARGITGRLVNRPVDTFTAFVKSALAYGQIFLPNLINKDVDMSDVLAEYSVGSVNEDARLSIAELIVKYGYPLEKHRVVTEDGYILSMFRIPGGGPPVFLMHGLLCSADDYVVAGPENGLAYLLSREGYDVWMGNARGNKHSRLHVRHQPSGAAFWDFSWHEIGYYDLPAMIDHVLNTTGHDTLKYIGHSQGTTSFFVMTSEKPEYNSKISLMVALSPVAFMYHIRSPLVRLLSPSTSILYGLTKLIGVNEFLPDSRMMRTFKYLMCGTGPAAEILCSNILFLIVGFGFDQLNATNLPVLYGHMPSGSAAKQFAHYGQGVQSGEFRKFDYGAYRNTLWYGTKQPPQYELGNIDVPVALFYSEADWMSEPKDVYQLQKRLNNMVDIYKVPIKEFNHMDFLWAKDFRTLIYERIKNLFKEF